MHPTSTKASGNLIKIGRSLYLSTHMVIILSPLGAGIKHEKSEASKSAKKIK